MTGPAGTVQAEIAEEMRDAARAWLDALGEEQRSRACFAFTDNETRRDWGYFPRRFHGLRLGAMDQAQQKLAHRLVSAALSLPAYARLSAVIGLENVLDIIEGRRRPEVRDPGRYFLSVFGEPGAGSWGWQFEGHHVSLNITIDDGEVVSTTPLFLGSNPAEVRHGGHTVIRVMGGEEDAARELLRSLDTERRERAVIAEEAPPDFVLMNAPRVPRAMSPGELEGPQTTMVAFAEYPAEQATKVRFDMERPAGLAVGDMDEGQRERFAGLLDVYLERLPGGLAAVERARQESAGWDALHFAWAGEESPGQGHYYRIQGPRLLIEYDNTQDGANHIHACWRDPVNDFGEDTLRAHVAREH